MKIEALYDRGIIVNYIEGDEALYRTPIYYIASTNDKYHTISQEQTLLSIAQKYYGSQFLWYLIADANDIITDIFDLPQGETIVIPDLSIIYSMYE